MGFDNLAKRYSAFALLPLISAAAYFQASGLTDFLASRLEVEPAQFLAALPAGTAVVPTSRPSLHTTSAEAIIARNPFDSVTGPLNRQPESDEAESPAGAVDYSDPYNAPLCSGDAQVLVIAAADEPSESLAAFSSKEGSPQMRRMGDEAANKRVWYIAWDRVWLQGDGELCQVRMFHAGEKPTVVAASVQTPTVVSGRGAPALPADIASKIQRVSATEFNVDRSVVDRILENQALVTGSIRIKPEQENGKVIGMRMSGIRPDTLLGTLGMQNGDRLDTINGFSIASPDKALEAYARLRTADRLSVLVNRGGKPVTLELNIK